MEDLKNRMASSGNVLRILMGRGRDWPAPKLKAMVKASWNVTFQRNILEIFSRIGESEG